MKCHFCYKLIPEDSYFCCYCGRGTNRHSEISKEKEPFSPSYKLTAYSWKDILDNDDRKDLSRYYGYSDFDACVPYKDYYDVARIGRSCTNYQTYQLMRFTETDRIVLKFKLHILERDRIFIAINFDWLEKELAVFDNKDLLNVIDYSMEYYKDGLKWILAEFHGGGLFWDKDLFERNSFLHVFHKVSSMFYSWDGVVSEIVSKEGAFTPIDNGPIIPHISKLLQIPGDLSFDIFIINNKSTAYNCPMINGHAMTHSLRTVLAKDYSVNTNESGTIPRFFFEQYELIEIVNSDESFISENLFRDEYAYWLFEEENENVPIGMWYSAKRIGL